MEPTMTRGELRVIADTDHVQCGDAATMANMLLNSNTVYQVLGSGGWRDVDADVFEPMKEAGLTVRVLYTAPRAVVAVDEIAEQEGIDPAIADAYMQGYHDSEARKPAPVAVPDRERVRGDHAKWSQETFGNVGPIGPLKHLSKEALEAAADPGDLSEWADMQFLLWDAQRRAGITDEQITAALEEKLKVNMAREWPEPKDGEPRLHIKAAPEQEV